MSPISREKTALLGFYGVFHLLWLWVLGPGFKTYKLLDFSHFLNPEWLRADFFTSLMLLHSQPPLMNILIGIIVKIAPDHIEIIFRLLYLAAGAAGLLALQATLRLLAIPLMLRFAVLIPLMAFPTFTMFATWYSSTHLEFSIFSVMLYGIARFCYLPSRRSLLLIAICGALLGLIRPQWHVVLFIALMAGLAKIGGRAWLKPALLASLIFIVPVGGWYAKNYALFGFFGGSSWMGANVGQVAHKAGISDLRRMKNEGLVSPSFPNDFIMPRIIRQFPPEPSHPAIGPLKSIDPGFLAYAQANRADHYVIYNLNYLGLIPSARRDMHDALVVFAHHPVNTVKVVLMEIFLTSLTPSFASHSLNLPDVQGWLESFVSPATGLVLFNFSALIFYLGLPLASLLLAGRLPPPARHFLWFCLGLMVFLTLTSHALNGYEQERMRWGWQGVYVICAALSLRLLCQTPCKTRSLA